MVPSHHAVFARKPVRAALAEDDVARNHRLTVGLLSAETFSRPWSGFVGSTLRCMGCVADLLKD